jgi:hypothetical protein
MNNSIRVTPIHHNTPCTIYEEINLQEEDTILQYQEIFELSILAPSFHPRIYEG